MGLIGREYTIVKRGRLGRWLLRVCRWHIRTGRRNCVIIALALWLEFGGYLVFRGTRMNKWRQIAWSHMLWLPPTCKTCNSLTSYVPTEELIRRLPPRWFDGHIKHGD